MKKILFILLLASTPAWAEQPKISKNMALAYREQSQHCLDVVAQVQADANDKLEDNKTTVKALADYWAAYSATVNASAKGK